MSCPTCVALVRNLLAIEEDTAGQHDPLANSTDSAESQHYTLIMHVPYFGSIRISCKGVSALSAIDLHQNQLLLAMQASYDACGSRTWIVL